MFNTWFVQGLDKTCVNSWNYRSGSIESDNEQSSICIEGLQNELWNIAVSAALRCEILEYSSVSFMNASAYIAVPRVKIAFDCNHKIAVS